MLRSERRLRSRRLVGLGALAVVVVVVAATVFARDGSAPVADGPVSHDGATGAVPTSTVARPAAPPRQAGRVQRERRRIAARLRAAVARAARLGGAVEAAVLLDDWSAPVVARATRTGSSAEVRMWSISKVATAVTLLRAMGWGDQAGIELGPELDEAFEGALTRSENCRQRRVVLGLQELVGSTDAAADSVAQTFELAGAHAVVAHATQLADPICSAYLAQLHGVRDPQARALTLGTSRWRVADAARFAYALGSGRYGTAVAREVLARMRREKGPSRESPPGNYTAELQWGAGLALSCLRPAYKAGWGGAQADRFVAEQIAIVRRRSGTAVIAVTFRPSQQPALDDPGTTVAPAGIEAVMRDMAPALADPAGKPVTAARCAAGDGGRS